MKRRIGVPILVSPDGSSRRLTPKPLAKSEYSEAWLQDLIQSNATVLPVAEIEPGFGHPYAICKELPLSLASVANCYLDNLVISDRGQIALVEVKLWRNPEARRKVVAQALDYAASLFSMSYSQLESAVQKTRGDDATIFSFISGLDDGGLDEPEFVDAVTRNMKAGRALVLLVGDGIREDVEALAELLQSHAGLRFVFGLVELSPYAMPDTDDVLIVPNILAKTTLIERGVVRLEQPSNSSVKFSISQSSIEKPQANRSRQTLSEDEFFELLAERDPEMRAALEAFLRQTAEIGIYIEMLGALNLKYPSEDARPYNLGTIQKNLTVDFAPATWFDRPIAGKRYCDRVAGLVGGTTKRAGYTDDRNEYGVRLADGKTMPRLNDLLPQHADAWLEAMQEYLESVH